MPDIMHLIKIRVPVDRVYEALTTAEGIRNWWTRDAVLDPFVGGTGEFRFHPSQTVTTVRIDELNAPLRIVWTTIASNAPGGWDGTTISFDLRAENNGTVLLLTHRGFAQADEGYAGVTTSWACRLVSLQLYLETGRGAPCSAANLAPGAAVRQ
jgi:uncharacterized protein YndB with AHSA1/START domain